MRNLVLIFLVALVATACGGDDGASADAAPVGDGGASDAPVIPPGRHHPLGFSAPAMHGPALEHVVEDCRSCHGADLTGAGEAPSCDGCHQPAWRTTCTYCHGGSDNQTGAPPRQLGGATDGGSFAPHTAHVESDITVPLVCEDCHQKPTDVLSTDHVFDATPGVAEVSLAGGRDPAATYSAGTCSNSTCHSRGRGTPGTITRLDLGLTCSGCHAGIDDVGNWDTMSGKHARHLNAGGLACGDCHATVTPDSTTIANLALHLDGAVSYSGQAAFNPTTKHCTGACHNHSHNDNW